MERIRPKSAGAVSSRTSAGSFTPISVSRPMTPSRTPRSPTTAFWAAGSPKSDTGVTSDMLDAKLTRKRAESDLQLLANRIALLRTEEERAKNKISETQQKADQMARYERYPIGAVYHRLWFMHVAGDRIKKRNEDNVKERMQKTLAHENRVRENQVYRSILLHFVYRRGMNSCF
jgi:hypothetical protein